MKWTARPGLICRSGLGLGWFWGGVELKNVLEEADLARQESREENQVEFESNRNQSTA